MMMILLKIIIILILVKMDSVYEHLRSLMEIGSIYKIISSSILAQSTISMSNRQIMSFLPSRIIYLMLSKHLSHIAIKNMKV